MIIGLNVKGLLFRRIQQMLLVSAACQLSLSNARLGVTIGLAWPLSIDDCTDDNCGV